MLTVEEIMEVASLMAYGDNEADEKAFEERSALMGVDTELVEQVFWCMTNIHPSSHSLLVAICIAHFHMGLDLGYQLALTNAEKTRRMVEGGE